MSEEHEKFEVKDRRKALLDDDEAAEPEAPKEEPAAQRKTEERPAQEEAREEPPKPGNAQGRVMPPPDFIAFIGSLGGSALMYLGERLSPDQPPMEVNLPAAQQMIDILDMLKQKTEGNLDEDERASLDNLLYNLKIRYAQAATAGKQSPTNP